MVEGLTVSQTHQFFNQKCQHLELVICIKMLDFIKFSNLDNVWVRLLTLELYHFPLLLNQHLVLFFNYLISAVKLKLKLLFSKRHRFFHDLKGLFFCMIPSLQGCGFGKNGSFFWHGNFLFETHWWWAIWLV